MSRDYLSTQPTSVSQQIANLAPFQALKTQSDKKVEFYVDEDGRADIPRPAQDRVIDGDRHVHVAYNATVEGSRKQPTGLITVTITDRSNSDDFRSPRSGNAAKGHVEETIFLRPQSPERIEAEVRRAADVLRSRARGS